jgi:hypothetical protein
MAVTLADLVLRAKQRCERVNSSFIPDSEWNTYVNEGMLELWDLLTMTWEDYGMVSYTIDIEPGVENYDLPTYDVTPGTPAVAATDAIIRNGEVVDVGATVTILGLDFVGVASLPTGAQFVVDTDLAVTMLNLANAINSSAVAGLVQATETATTVELVAVIAGVSGNAVTMVPDLTATGFSDTGGVGHLTDGAAAVPGTGTQYQIYKLRGVDLNSAGNTYTLSQFQFRQRNKFKQAWPFNSALYARIMYYQLLGNQIRVIPAPTLADTMTLWYVPQLPLMTASVDLNSFIPEPYVDFIVASASAKAKVKEDDDPSGMYADKQAMAKRIQNAAKTRVAGEPRCIVDVRNDTDLDEFYQHRMRY